MVCMCAGGARVEDAESASGCGRGGHRRHPEGVLRRPEGGGAQSSAQVSQSAGVQDYYTIHVHVWYEVLSSMSKDSHVHV